MSINWHAKKRNILSHLEVPRKCPQLGAGGAGDKINIHFSPTVGYVFRERLIVQSSPYPTAKVLGVYLLPANTDLYSRILIIKKWKKIHVV